MNQFLKYKIIAKKKVIFKKWVGNEGTDNDQPESLSCCPTAQ